MFLTIYIIGTPVGILIGTLVGKEGGFGFIVLIGLAGGIFVYMATCNLIIPEFHDSEDINPLDERSTEEKTKTQRIINLIKFSITLLGFAIPTGVAIYESS